MGVVCPEQMVMSNGHKLPIEKSKTALRSANQSVMLESGGLAVAEITSIGASLGVVAIADQVAPKIMGNATKFVAKHFIEPHLEAFEGFLSSVCHLQECKPDRSQSREKRAESLAHATVIFVPSFVTGLAVKIATRRGMNKLCGIVDDATHSRAWWEFSKHEKIILCADEGVHIGSMILLNTGAAGVTDDLIRASSGVLQKMGFSEQKSKDISSMAMIWELPNLLGLMSGVGAILGIHKLGWAGGVKQGGPHAKKILEKAASHAVSPLAP